MDVMDMISMISIARQPFYVFCHALACTIPLHSLRYESLRSLIKDSYNVIISSFIEEEDVSLTANEVIVAASRNLYDRGMRAVITTSPVGGPAIAFIGYSLFHPSAPAA